MTRPGSKLNCTHLPLSLSDSLPCFNRQIREESDGPLFFKDSPPTSENQNIGLDPIEGNSFFSNLFKGSEKLGLLCGRGDAVAVILAAGIYIYIYMCVCVCVSQGMKHLSRQKADY